MNDNSMRSDNLANLVSKTILNKGKSLPGVAYQCKVTFNLETNDPVLYFYVGM